MNQETIFKEIINHVNMDADCTICRCMNWEKDCPWKNDEVPYETNVENCIKHLSNKLSTNIKIESQKIECTEEGAKFFTTLFNNLENYEPR
ncbi:MAG: hypothetical protein E7059_02430 [Treponema bryantii]|nr:hypothetical protein [Treponema bryantii]